MNNCKNCNEETSKNYCANCGQPTKLKRIDSHYIQHEIEHVLHFEKGILYTIKELLLRPGQNIKEFITENRSRLVKPIIFIIISSLIYSIIAHFFHIKDSYVNLDGTKNSATFSINNWIRSHYGYSNIIMAIFISFWLKIFFKKAGYNLFEILILLCFIMGMGMLIFSVFAILEGLTKFHLMQISAVIFLIYSTWAIGQFFDKRKITSYLKACAAYVLGMATFSLSAIFLGFIIDLIIKP
ncbi:DUF3667 domain-containing protein [Pedobacter sp. ASV28]|uniref:DUF3667 domain-containing protein n=1 Tax=Pedobacter sp. ASV28 TaxID=2795123 RepID=UPI0018EA8E4B|nr:DUF3667 domain-containing protein [Pedobacter sp. ASV28]